MLSKLRKNKGFLLVVALILIGMSMVIFIFLNQLAVKSRESKARVDEKKLFYIADAGVDKALWYLGTPVLSGGKGMLWRTTGTTETYAGGTYTISVQDSGTTNEVTIVSTGEYLGARKMIIQKVAMGGLPDAFKYSMYSGGLMTMNGGATVYGDVYVDDNTYLPGNNVIYGKIYHPNGTSINNAQNSTYTDGGALTPAPSAPAFDKSYYTNLINVAKTYPAGSLDYNTATTVNLNGGTIYVNGDIHINQPVIFNGPGRVVASGSIMYNVALTANGPVEFICQNGLNMNYNTIASDSVFYTAGTLINNANARIDSSSLLAMAGMTINGTSSLKGLLYSEGNIIIQGNAQIDGSVVALGSTTCSGTVTITYNLGELPSTSPKGFTPTSIMRKPGTWKG